MTTVETVHDIAYTIVNIICLTTADRYPCINSKIVFCGMYKDWMNSKFKP